MKKKEKLKKECDKEYSKIFENEIKNNLKNELNKYKVIFFKNKRSGVELLIDDNYYYIEISMLFSFKNKIVDEKLILKIKSELLNFFNQKYCLYLSGSTASIKNIKINPNDYGYSFEITVKHYMKADHIINYKKNKINFLINQTNG